MQPDAIHIASPQPVPEEKSGPLNKLPKPKKPSPLVLFLLLIAVIAVIAIYYFSSQINKLEQQTTQVPAADSTNEWKKYTATDVGFIIRYPDNWFFEENKDFQQPRVVPGALETAVMFADFPPPFLGPADVIPKGCRFDVLVAETEIDQTQLLETAAYKEIGPGLSPTSEVAISVNSIEGIRMTYLPNGNEIRTSRTLVLLPVPSLNRLYGLYFWGDESNNTHNLCSDTFETMLQSFSIFEFLDDERGDWKTYTNSEYGYSVKYPMESPPLEHSEDIYLNYVSFGGRSKEGSLFFEITVREASLNEEVDYVEWQSSHSLVRLTNKEDLTIAGFPAKRLDYEPLDNNTLKPSSVIIINRNQYSYTINSRPEEINQILSTLKFLD